MRGIDLHQAKGCLTQLRVPGGRLALPLLRGRFACCLFLTANPLPLRAFGQRASRLAEANLISGLPVRRNGARVPGHRSDHGPT